jgi:nucleotide-binding universal stress UspA family protein
MRAVNMDPIRSILVHVDAGPYARARLELAAALGRAHEADVIALYAVTPVFVEMAFNVAMGAPPQALIDIDESRLSSARQLVAAVAAESGVPIEWRAAPEGPEHSTIAHALCADLVLLGQPDRARRDTGVLPDFVPWVVTGSGKPAIVVPYIGARAAPFGHVLVAWKGTREAARALAASIPLLRRAQNVSVATDLDTPQSQKDLLLTHLRRHGVQATPVLLSSDGSDAGAAILSLAADVGAELIVMGCYGHSRAREFVLGGATRTVLQSMTVPVLMAH